MKKYTLSQVEDIFDKLKYIYNDFKNRHVERLIQNVITTDGVKMNISIPLNSVPHLLGVNTDYYKAVFTTKESSAEKIFEEMLSRGAYNIYSNMDKIDIDRLISPYILNKLENFINVTRIDSRYIEFVCHYDRKKAYKVADKSADFDHLIVSKLENGKYSYITFSDNNYKDMVQTIPRSNQLINSEDELFEKIGEILAKQNITIPTLTSCYDRQSDIYKFKWFLSEDEKRQKALNALKYANMLDSDLNVFNDYISSLGFSGRKTKKHKENTNILNSIALAIKKGKIINEKDLDIDSFDILSDEMVTLIETYNNMVALNLSEDGKNGNGPKFNYSNMKKEIFDLKFKINELEKKINELEDTNKVLERKYSDSEDDLSKYKEKMISIVKIINS